MQKAVYENRILIEEFGKLCLEGAWQDLEQVRHLLVCLKLHVWVIIAEVIRQFINESSTNVKLLVKLINLLDSFLVGGV